MFRLKNDLKSRFWPKNDPKWPFFAPKIRHFRKTPCTWNISRNFGTFQRFFTRTIQNLKTSFIIYFFWKNLMKSDLSHAFTHSQWNHFSRIITRNQLFFIHFFIYSFFSQLFKLNLEMILIYAHAREDMIAD